MPRRGTERKTFLRARHPGRPKGTKHLEKVHVKKNDVVEVVSGEDKGKRGTIQRVLPRQGKVVVQGVNNRWRHLRRSQENPQGGRLEREQPMWASKVRKVQEEG